MTDVQTFNNEMFGEVKVVMYKDNLCFYALEVAATLGYTNPSKAVSDHCKSLILLDYNETLESNLGNNRKGTRLIKEADLYRLVLHSKLPSAEKFQDWIVEDVLPSLRKHGGYVVAQETMTKEQYLASALIMAQSVMDEKDGVIKEQSEQINVLSFVNATLEEKVEMLKPKEEFFDAINRATNAIDFKTFAGKLISQATGKPYGRNKLLKDLREMNILNSKNQPYQQFADYFDVVTSAQQGHIVSTTYVKPKGVTYLTGRLVKTGMAQTCLH